MSNVLREIMVASILSVTAVAQGAEYEVHPSLAVSEEYTDNLYETPANRVTDYITRTLPGIAASYTAPVLTANLNYVFDYRHYAREYRQDETTHALSAKGHLAAIDNFMYLDVNEEYQRVSLDVTRDVTKESLFFNLSDRNVVTASPYFTLHPTARIQAIPGYRFIDTRYFGPVGIDKTDHIAYLNMKYEMMNRWSLTADYTFTRELAVIDNFDRHQALGGFRYEYADKSFVFAQAGGSWIKYDSGQSLNNIIWNAGATHEFGAFTATITTGVKYDEDPLRNSMQESFINGNFEKRFQRGTLSLFPYYSEYVLIETDTLQTKKYGGVAQGSYEITADLKGRVALTAEKYEQRLLGSHTLRFLVDSGLNYLLAKQLTASISYIYVDYSSPGIAVDNWNGNRAMLEIKKTF